MSAMPDDIILEGVGLTKHFGGGGLLHRRPIVRAVDGVSLAHPARRDLRHRRRIRLRQVHTRPAAPAPDRADRRRRALRGPIDPGARHERAAQLRRELQIIFQDPYASLNPRMNVGDIIAEPIWLHDLGIRPREARARGRPHAHGRPAADARATAIRTSSPAASASASASPARWPASPKLIIGDEPVSALDVSIQAQIINLLEDLKDALRPHPRDHRARSRRRPAYERPRRRHVSRRDRRAGGHGCAVRQPAASLHAGAARRDPRAEPAAASRRRCCRATCRARPLRRPAAASTPAAPMHVPCARSSTRPWKQRRDGRQVACHFWREIQGAGAGSISAPPPSAALAKRLALYRTWRERQDKPVATSP